MWFSTAVACSSTIVAAPGQGLFHCWLSIVWKVESGPGPVSWGACFIAAEETFCFAFSKDFQPPPPPTPRSNHSPIHKKPPQKTQVDVDGIYKSTPLMIVLPLLKGFRETNHITNTVYFENVCTLSRYSQSKKKKKSDPDMMESVTFFVMVHTHRHKSTKRTVPSVFKPSTHSWRGKRCLFCSVHSSRPQRDLHLWPDSYHCLPWKHHKIKLYTKLLYKE